MSCTEQFKSLKIFPPALFVLLFIKQHEFSQTSCYRFRGIQAIHDKTTTTQDLTKNMLHIKQFMEKTICRENNTGHSENKPGLYVGTCTTMLHM